jgi:SAM-dependent methyltransferase
VAHRDLPLTGERTAPGIWHENYWFRRHEAAYEAVPRFVGRAVPRLVLDAGCGEGYAAGLLGARWPGAVVVGVDYDPAATAHARQAYAGERAAYLRGAVTALPLESGVADLTVSLQVLEHIWTPLEYVRELVRVTRAEGCMVLSTPNRLTFSPGLARLGRPPDAYHVREYDAQELDAELRRWLPGWTVELHGLRPGPCLREAEGGHAALVATLQSSAPDAWSPRVAGLVRSVRAGDFETCAAVDEDCLDLVAVLRQTG